jgi:hypothetical protein
VRTVDTAKIFYCRNSIPHFKITEAVNKGKRLTPETPSLSLVGHFYLFVFARIAHKKNTPRFLR